MTLVPSRSKIIVSSLGKWHKNLIVVFYNNLHGQIKARIILDVLQIFKSYVKHKNQRLVSSTGLK